MFTELAKKIKHSSLGRSFKIIPKESTLEIFQKLTHFSLSPDVLTDLGQMSHLISTLCSK